DEAKRIVVSMLRDVRRERFVKEVETAIMRNSGPAMPTLRARLDLLENALPALKKGNILDFTYLPGAGTLMRCQGRELTIPGKDFAEALFSTWLGPKPVNATLKRELLSASGKQVESYPGSLSKTAQISDRRPKILLARAPIIGDGPAFPLTIFLNRWLIASWRLSAPSGFRNVRQDPSRVL
ncbi:MAG: chalcone isomerase family protein, partial [Bradyrhizobium sp.]